jgi:hypothetical protein
MKIIMVVHQKSPKTRTIMNMKPEVTAFPQVLHTLRNPTILVIRAPAPFLINFKKIMRNYPTPSIFIKVKHGK